MAYRPRLADIKVLSVGPTNLLKLPEGGRHKETKEEEEKAGEFLSLSSANKALSSQTEAQRGS